MKKKIEWQGKKQTRFTNISEKMQQNSGSNQTKSKHGTGCQNK